MSIIRSVIKTPRHQIIHKWGMNTVLILGFPKKFYIRNDLIHSNLRITIYQLRFQIPNSKSQIPNPKFQIPNPKSQIPNSKFQIPIYELRVTNYEFTIAIS